MLPLKNDRDRIAREAMADVLGLREELHDEGDQYRLNGHRNPSTSLRMTFDLMPRAGPASTLTPDAVVIARIRP